MRATKGASLSALRRVTQAVKPSRANRRAMAPPVASPAPMTRAALVSGIVVPHHPTLSSRRLPALRFVLRGCRDQLCILLQVAVLDPTRGAANAARWIPGTIPGLTPAGVPPSKPCEQRPAGSLCGGAALADRQRLDTADPQLDPIRVTRKMSATSPRAAKS